MELLIFSLIALGNVWIWKILLNNIFVGALLLLATLFFVLRVFNNKYSKIFIVLFTSIIVIQINSTNINSLTHLDNYDIYVRDTRLSEYPPVHLTIFGKTVWIPAAHWIEGRKESVAFFRLLDNFSEVADPNLYFFANHPRERVGFEESEKFPFIFLPVFLYGTIFLIRKCPKKILFVTLLIPIFILTLVGHNNKFGSLSLFPFITASTTFGFINSYKQLRTAKKYKVWISVFIILFLIVLVQSITYELY